MRTTHILTLCLFMFLCSCASETKHAVAPTVMRDFPPETMLLPEESGLVELDENSGIDYGNAAKGYIMAWYSGTKQAKIQVMKLEKRNEAENPQWNYDVELDQHNLKDVLPLQGDSGRYRILVAEQIEGTRYSPLVTAEFDVVLENEFSPFLYPNKYAMYSDDSLCAEKAKELTRGCTSDIEAVNKIYSFIKENIKYDVEKAEKVDAFYAPDPDAVLTSGTGICTDYASLVCAMLRVNRIPAKMITGKVDENLNHAWNSIYLENEGWVDVKLYMDLQSWELIDLTFAAGDISSEMLTKYIGKGEHYTALKTY